MLLKANLFQRINCYDAALREYQEISKLAGPPDLNSKMARDYLLFCNRTFNATKSLEQQQALLK